MDVSTAGIGDGLRRADAGFLIKGADSTDLRVGRRMSVSSFGPSSRVNLVAYYTALISGARAMMVSLKPVMHSSPTKPLVGTDRATQPCVSDSGRMPTLNFALLADAQSVPTPKHSVCVRTTERFFV